MVYVHDFASTKIYSNSDADLFQTFNSLLIIWLTLSFFLIPRWIRVNIFNTLLQTITGKAEKISDDGFITDKV